MKTQWMAWMISGLMLSIPMVPSLAQADTNSLTQLFPALVGVTLTPAQQIQLENLSYQTLPQVQQLLTSEQQAQY